MVVSRTCVWSTHHWWRKTRSPSRSRVWRSVLIALCYQATSGLASKTSREEI